MEKSSIVGHARQIANLETDLASGNVSHAYLFVGPEHLGKSTVARWFATELLTRGLDPEDKAAAEAQIERLIHRDFLSLDKLWIEDQSEDLDEIAESSNIQQSHRWKSPAMRSDVISIDDVRVIQERVYETGEGARRVCFIRDIDRLQDAAANAFLKILEEPPEGRVFILTTSSDSLLLSTIVSRSRVLRFDRVADADIARLLSHVPEGDRSFILHVAQGAPGTAITLASDPDRLREDRLMHGQATAFWGPMSTSERLKALSPITDKAGDGDRFILHLALALRESPGHSVARVDAFRLLMRRLQTNAYKPLIVQEFALSIA
jgi:DNA polymerase-3 subunit delta'